jgi:hypothetical protein
MLVGSSQAPVHPGASPVGQLHILQVQLTVLWVALNLEDPPFTALDWVPPLCSMSCPRAASDISPANFYLSCEPSGPIRTVWWGTGLQSPAPATVPNGSSSKGVRSSLLLPSYSCLHSTFILLDGGLETFMLQIKNDRP